MNTINGLLDSISSVLKSSTGTGLDVLEHSPTPAAIALELFEQDTIPATASDITAAYRRITGQAADEVDLLGIEQFLLSLGFLA